MREIGAAEMAAALARYIAFEGAHIRLEDTELQRRLERGENPGLLLREQFSEMDHEAMADAVSDLCRAVGLGELAMHEFWRDLPRILHTETDWALDHAAFAGLVIGLLARSEAGR